MQWLQEMQDELRTKALNWMLRTIQFNYYMGNRINIRNINFNSHMGLSPSHPIRLILWRLQLFV